MTILARVGALVALLAAGAAEAQEAAAPHGERLARSEYVQGLIRQMASPEAVRAFIPDAALPPAMAEALGAAIADEFAKLQPALVDAAAAAAAERFTAEEVGALLDFYESEIGRSIAAKTPAFMADVNRRIAPDLAAAQARVMQRLMSGMLK